MRHEDGTFRPVPNEDERHELSKIARTLLVSDVLQSKPLSAEAVGKRRLRAERKEIEAIKEDMVIERASYLDLQQRVVSEMQDKDDHIKELLESRRKMELEVARLRTEIQQRHTDTNS